LPPGNVQLERPPDHKEDSVTEESQPAGRYGILDEADLLDRLRAGDEPLFREVVEKLTPVLLRLARGYTPTASAAQDAVQDTWLVVLDKLDTFEGRSSLKTWTCGILVNKARRSGVKESRTLPFSSAWRDDRSPAVDPSRFHSRGSSGPAGTWSNPPVSWDQMPEERLASQEMQRVIHAAIAGLPIRQREVITARDVVGMDAPEAAAILNLTSGNQRVLLHRARSKVRATLEQYAADASDDPASGGAARVRRHDDRSTS
jgi:RNA polymerase sigma-70 factor (ECF subfamily)